MKLQFTFAKATKNCFAYECLSGETTGMLYIKQAHATAPNGKPIKSFAVDVTPTSEVAPDLESL